MASLNRYTLRRVFSGVLKEEVLNDPEGLDAIKTALDRFKQVRFHEGETNAGEVLEYTVEDVLRMIDMTP